MRLLWARYGARGVGFPDDASRRCSRRRRASPLGDFFDGYVRGRDELDLSAILAHGRASSSTVAATERGAAAWLGVHDSRSTGDGAWSPPRSRAARRSAAGLYAGDEIVALDGFRVDAGALKERLGERKPGRPSRSPSSAAMSCARSRSSSASLPRTRSRSAAPEATSTERAAFEPWLGARLPDPTKPGGHPPSRRHEGAGGAAAEEGEERREQRQGRRDRRVTIADLAGEAAATRPDHLVSRRPR